jgi:hypothetical protein
MWMHGTFFCSVSFFPRMGPIQFFKGITCSFCNQNYTIEMTSNAPRGGLGYNSFLTIKIKGWLYSNGWPTEPLSVRRLVVGLFTLPSTFAKHTQVHQCPTLLSRRWPLPSANIPKVLWSPRHITYSHVGTFSKTNKRGWWGWIT